jgi:aspartate/methionine/tyrosine aminotransferase
MDQIQTHKVSDRISLLGTETAYAIADEAVEAAKTQKVYSFHIGDLNFPSPKVLVDAMNKAIQEKKTGYCPAGGIPELRDALAKDVGSKRGVKYTRENVSIQSGGKPVITKFLQVVMNPGDEVLYPNPGYPIYESQVSYLGGVCKPYKYIETQKGFALDMDYMKKLVTKGKTKVFIYNNYQNPTGSVSSDEEMAAIAKFCIENDLLVLADEAYFNLTFGNTPKSIVSLPGMQERTVILYTYSKTYAMTGWRLGAAIGPEWIISMITRLNVNDEGCTTNFIQWAGISAFTEEAENFNKQLNDELKVRRDVLVEELKTIPGISCHVPESTFYLFCNVSPLTRKLNLDYEPFRKLVLQKTGVSFCTREHFGKSFHDEKDKYIRFAYSGINVDQIKEACQKLREFCTGVLPPEGKF